MERKLFRQEDCRRIAVCFSGGGGKASLILALVRTAIGERTNPYSLGFYFTGVVQFEVSDLKKEKKIRKYLLSEGHNIGHVTLLLLDYIERIRFFACGAQHRFTHGLSVACSLRICSAITFLWQASSLGDAQSLRRPVYLQ